MTLTVQMPVAKRGQGLRPVNRHQCEEQDSIVQPYPLQKLHQPCHQPKRPSEGESATNECHRVRHQRREADRQTTRPQRERGLIRVTSNIYASVSTNANYDLVGGREHTQNAAPQQVILHETYELNHPHSPRRSYFRNMLMKWVAKQMKWVAKQHTKSHHHKNRWRTATNDFKR